MAKSADSIATLQALQALGGWRRLREVKEAGGSLAGLIALQASDQIRARCREIPSLPWPLREWLAEPPAPVEEDAHA